MENAVLRRMNLNSFLMVSRARIIVNALDARANNVRNRFRGEERTRNNFVVCSRRNGFSSRLFPFIYLFIYFFLYSLARPQVPVQRVTKYPLLLARLYKVTPEHHLEARQTLNEARHKIQLHLEHINSVSAV